jgi:hypothetical protein
VFDNGMGSELYVGGNFAFPGSGGYTSLAKWSAAGWSAIPGGAPGQPGFSSVLSLKTFDDGMGAGPALYVGGAFDSINGAPIHGIARLRHAQWSSLGTGTAGFGSDGSFSVVEALRGVTTANGPVLYAGGQFLTANGHASSRIGAWEATCPGLAFCFGDGTGAACPCSNSGASGHGCQNSASTGGAVLSSAGQASLSADTLSLTSSGELPSSFSIPSQGTATILPLVFGDGVRCVGGALKRLYKHNASGGVLTVPQAGDLTISARSAALGDVITPGSTRYYYTYYRDPSPTFCTSPPGNTWNVTNSLAIQWGP